MTLTLTIQRGPPGVPAETRQVRSGEFSIGRAADNDWTLPDPERHLSKRHCVVALRDGEWQLADLSTNGTFLNRATEPIGVGRVCDLRDGDRMRLGIYQIEVQIAAAPQLEPQAAPFAPPVPAENPFAEFSLGSTSDPLSFTGPSTPDHSPVIEDAYRPPSPVALLGEDWDLDLDPAPAAAAPPVAPPAEPVPDLLAAFLRGARYEGARPTDPAAAMEALGATFRALVSGLREAIAARAAVKGEFRIEQTMIRARGNNPLKFSTGDDDALAALLGVGRRTEMGPAEAVTEALRDLRLHELATVAAMQSAMRALLRELSPETMRDAGGQGLLPAQRRARAWDTFEARYARLTQTLDDSTDGVFARTFSRAYERALRDAGGQRP